MLIYLSASAVADTRSILSQVKQVCRPSFYSLRSVAMSRLKKSVCPIIYHIWREND